MGRLTIADLPSRRIYPLDGPRVNPLALPDGPRLEAATAKLLEAMRVFGELTWGEVAGFVLTNLTSAEREVVLGRLVGSGHFSVIERPSKSHSNRMVRVYRSVSGQTAPRKRGRR